MHTQPTPALLPTRRTALLAFGIGVTALVAHRPARAQATAAAPLLEAPPELSAYAPAWNARGSGALRFFGFKAYDATLWLPAGQTSYAPNRSFALDIRYNTTVKASDIVNTSLIEMSRLASATPEQIKAWTTFMTQLFVDVKSGDRLVGVRVPDKGARFFLNAKLLGESPDEAFTDAFFRIWLDPKTRRPELRDALLGTATAAAPTVRSP
ncbi:chalcone isomerase family protein [Curvibacter sp. APW13]|uniref:chalcone isomerase family protein n=1 Tax=Curvibacter sp. APW13 TaxID=3077236 RepID=UPI0028DE7D47|nr:chalcone isomerase family protein [Curvibacter sp. APW13]MDT8989424.1 chalcone isomerase family protein [Curvibacter sp. APW13]